MRVQLTIEGSALSHDLTVCTRCRAMLTRYDFGTDDLGRTIERCPKCGPALLAVRRGVPLKQVYTRPEPKMIEGCADCHGWMLWNGTGGKPSRCVECQQRHRRVTQLARYYTLQGKRA